MKNVINVGSAPECNIHYGVCNTDIGLHAKEVNIPGFKLINNPMVCVRFNGVEGMISEPDYTDTIIIEEDGTSHTESYLTPTTLNISNTGSKIIVRKYTHNKVSPSINKKYEYVERSSLISGEAYTFALDGDYYVLVGRSDGRSEVDAELKTDSHNPVENSTLAERFQEVDTVIESLKQRNSSFFCTCDTAADEKYKKAVVVGGGEFSRYPGVCVDVQFANGNTVIAYGLSVNNTGAAPISYTSNMCGVNENAWVHGQIVRFIYDGTCWVMENTIPASTTNWGVTRLSDSVGSTSNSHAATSYAVKRAYDLANDAIPKSQRGASDGVATLDAKGKIPAEQLPSLSSSGVSTYYGVCDTVDTVEQKIVTVSDEQGVFALKQGVALKITFTNITLITYGVSFNVNGTGEKYVYISGTMAPPAWTIFAGETVEFMFNGEYWVFNFPFATTGSYGMVALSNSVSGEGNNGGYFAATPTAVKQAYDLAKSAIPKYNNAGAHNSIFRGKNLGTSVTETQYTSISDGTFDDLYIGDYWTINGVNWRIASFDYYYGVGDPIKCTTHHAVVVPDTNLYNHIMHEMPNSWTNTTEGGYVGSKMYSEGLDEAKNIIRTAFSDHILTHRIYLTNAVTNGIPSAGAWCDSEVDLMNEQMVYGCPIYMPMPDGSTILANDRAEKSQLPLFFLNPRYISTGSWYFLRDVISATQYAEVRDAGAAGYTASGNAAGVRPFFCIS